MPISAINPAMENDFVSENAMSFHVILPGHVEGAIFARLLRGSFLGYHRPIPRVKSGMADIEKALANQ